MTSSTSDIILLNFLNTCGKSLVIVMLGDRYSLLHRQYTPMFYGSVFDCFKLLNVPDCQGRGKGSLSEFLKLPYQ